MSGPPYSMYDPWLERYVPVNSLGSMIGMPDSSSEDPWVEDRPSGQDAIPQSPRFSFPLEFRLHPLVQDIANLPEHLRNILTQTVADGPCCSLPFLITDRQHAIFCNYKKGAKFFRRGTRMRNILYRFYTMRATLFHDANVVHCESLPLKYGTPFFTLQSVVCIPGGHVNSFVICLQQIEEVET